MAAGERLARLRSSVVSALNDFDLTLWDKLDTYTMALQQAQYLWEVAVKTPRVPRALIEHAKQQFELLYAIVQGLVTRGLLDQVTLKRAKQYRGRYRYAWGLRLLVEELRQAWARVADKTGLTEGELIEAELAGERLATGIARRNVPAEQGQQLAQMRDRAFTLFIYAYGQVRRAVQYLRWDHNDADAYAPSLYRRQHKRRAQARAKLEVPSEQAPQPSGPAPNQQQENVIEPGELAVACAPVVEYGCVPQSQPEAQAPLATASHECGRASAQPGATQSPAASVRAHAAHRKRRLGKRRSRLHRLGRFVSGGSGNRDP